MAKETPSKRATPASGPPRTKATLAGTGQTQPVYAGSKSELAGTGQVVLATVTPKATARAAQRARRAQNRRTRAILRSKPAKAQKRSQLTVIPPKPNVPEFQAHITSGNKVVGAGLAPTRPEAVQEARESKKYTREGIERTFNAHSANGPDAVAHAQARKAREYGFTRLAKRERERLQGKHPEQRQDAHRVPRKVQRAVKAELKQARKVVHQTTGITGPLVPEQKRFVRGVAKHTKLSPRAVAAQALAEESGSAAQNYEASGEHNYLNIGPGQHFGSNREAVRETSHLLNTSPDYAGIRATRGQGAAAQIQAIGNSPWGTVLSTMEGTLPQVGVKHNPKAVKRLKAVEARAEQLGLHIGPNAGRRVTVPGRGRYVFPFPENKGWSWSRTDMGTDFAYSSEGAPIRSLGSGTIVKTGAPGWPGEGGVLLKLDHAKHLPSPYIYIYEGVNPTVEAGQHVKAGQTIATGGITGSIEIGFADSSGNALAHEIYTEGMETSQGKVMTNFLHGIEEGRKRIPVRLLQVGGTLVPSSGGMVATSGGAVEGTIPPSSTRARSRHRRKQQTAPQILAKLKRFDNFGGGTTKAKAAPSEGSSVTLADLEKKYGKAAA